MLKFFIQKPFQVADKFSNTENNFIEWKFVQIVSFGQQYYKTADSGKSLEHMFHFS